MSYSIKHYWGNDITRIRTNIIANLELFKNKYLVSDYLAKILGKNLNEKARKELAKKIGENIQGIPDDTLNEISKQIKSKSRSVNLLFAMITEVCYSIENKTDETQRLLDILNKRFIQNGMAPDGSNAKDIDTKWITNDEPQDSIYFDYLLALTLRQTPLQEVNDFLNFQSIQYKGDFKAFMGICLKEYEILLNPKTTELAIKWLASPVVISDTKELNDDKKLTVSLPRIKRDKNDGITVLTADQSAYLMLFLKDSKIILRDNTYQTNEEMAKALQIMTGYKAGQARKTMSTPIEKIDKKELKVLKTTVENLLSSIKKHL